MFVYILSNRSLNFYVGVANDLLRRIEEHKNKVNPKSFTSKYTITKLVYFEYYETPDEAICREKYLKRRGRQEKLHLVFQQNATFRDLYKELPELLS